MTTKWIAATKWENFGNENVLVSHSFGAPIIIQKWSDGWYASPDKYIARSTDPKWDELPYEDVVQLVRHLECTYSFEMGPLIGDDAEGSPDFS